MNNSMMDNLISGLTKNLEPASGSEDKPSKDSNIGNPSNANNPNNTGNKHNPKKNGLPNNTSNTDNTAVADEHETRFCTIVDVNVLQKIRIIANREGLLIKDVVGAAFTKAITTYEAKHGPVKGDARGRVDSLF